MSQVTVTTTTLPVKVVWSGALIRIMTDSIDSTSVGLAAALGQHYMVLLPPLIPRVTLRGVVGITTVLQLQLQSKIPYQACASYAVVSQVNDTLLTLSALPEVTHVHFIM